MHTFRALQLDNKTRMFTQLMFVQVEGPLESLIANSALMLDEKKIKVNLSKANLSKISIHGYSKEQKEFGSFLPDQNLKT